LHCIVTCLKKPLDSLSLITEEESIAIFGNVETLLTQNILFLNALKLRINPATWNVGCTVGDVFEANIHLLRPHIDYVKGFSKAKEMLASCRKKSEKLRQFLDIVRWMPASHNKTIDDFLIQPVQRTPRYRVLLEDITKRTNKKHPDFALLQKALKSVSQLATEVNEETRKDSMVSDWNKEKEAIHGASELSQNSERGQLDKLTNALVILKTKKDQKPEVMDVFLLTDFLLLTKKNKQRLSLNKLSGFSMKIVEAIPLTKGTLIKPATEKVDNAEMAHLLDVSGHLVAFPHADQLDLWNKLGNAACHQ